QNQFNRHPQIIIEIMKAVNDQSGHEDGSISIFVDDFLCAEHRGERRLRIILIPKTGDKGDGCKSVLMIEDIIHHFLDIIDDHRIAYVMIGEWMVTGILIFTMSNPGILDQFDKL